MSYDMQVGNYIDQNNWKGLASFLEDEKGFIHLLGGRCIGGKFVEIDGYSNFNAVCWKIFKKGVDQTFSENELNDFSCAIVELDRIYKETQTNLKTCSIFLKFSTAIFDCPYQQCADGLTSIERLKSIPPFKSHHC